MRNKSPTHPRNIRSNIPLPMKSVARPLQNVRHLPLQMHPRQVVGPPPVSQSLPSETPCSSNCIGNNLGVLGATYPSSAVSSTPTPIQPDAIAIEQHVPTRILPDAPTTEQHVPAPIRPDAPAIEQHVPRCNSMNSRSNPTQCQSNTPYECSSIKSKRNPIIMSQRCGSINSNQIPKQHYSIKTVPFTSIAILSTCPKGVVLLTVALM